MGMQTGIQMCEYLTAFGSTDHGWWAYHLLMKFIQVVGENWASILASKGDLALLIRSKGMQWHDSQSTAMLDGKDHLHDFPEDVP